MYKLSIVKERTDTTKPWLGVDSDTRGLTAYTPEEVSNVLVPYWSLLGNISGKHNDSISVSVTDTIYQIDIIFDTLQSVQEYLNILKPTNTNPVVQSMIGLVSTKRASLGIEGYTRNISITEVV